MSSQRATVAANPEFCSVIAFVELVERFSYYGTTVVFTNFIQQPLPDGSRTGAGGRDGQSGALGMGQRASTGKLRAYRKMTPSSRDQFTGLTTFNQFWYVRVISRYL